MIIVPKGQYARTDQLGKSLQAELSPACGSWVLMWEDGYRQDLNKSSAPVENCGYSRQRIIEMVSQ